MSFINLYTGRFQFTHATANLDVVGDMAILDSRLGERFLQRGNGNQKNLRDDVFPLIGIFLKGAPFAPFPSRNPDFFYRLQSRFSCEFF